MNNYTIKPPSGEKWDFDNVTHKKKIKEILIERDGNWCNWCGITYSLEVHHKATRGRYPAQALLFDVTNGIYYYRDDPYNLIFLCNIPHRIFYQGKEYFDSCHGWVTRNTVLAEQLGLITRPIIKN